MTQIREDVFGACNSLVTNQMDLIEEYSKRGILSCEQIISIIEMINRIDYLLEIHPLSCQGCLTGKVSLHWPVEHIELLVQF